MKKLFRLEGKVQNYVWGGQEYISNLLGLENKNEIIAEYWLGAHDNSPSMVIDGDQKIELNSFLKDNLKDNLGVNVANEFGRLPFLFKVLDVEEMLSIQVHPSKKEAEKGFRKENELGIPLNASNRNYKDDNHKPEIMVALSEFWLLHGFLAKDKLLQVLKDVPEFNELIEVFHADGYYGLYKTVMSQSQDECNQKLSSLIDRILPMFKEGKLDKSTPEYWAAKTVDSNNDAVNLDKGIYSIFFFNIVKAEKGQAIFQDSGIPHAYLEGKNMELMANSDNVLRGGLTPKHVDVQELLKHVIFEETVPDIINGEFQNNGLEKIFKSPAPDFELSQIELKKNDVYNFNTTTVEIIILLEGTATIEEGNIKIEMTKGDSVLLLANSHYRITSDKNAKLFKATSGVK